MKKLIGMILIIGTVLCLSIGTASAKFNYGVDTYSTDSSTLILNSTGDQTSSSTLATPNANLGTNDFIGELAVKNELLLNGYTVAYDSNNPTALAQCYSQYNEPLPTGVALTQLQFAGLNGDPRAMQNVYVKTSEYDALSAQGQANSISHLTSGLSNEVTRATGAENVLQSHINNETTRATGAENVLQTSIHSESVRAMGAESILQGNINSVNVSSIARDAVLQHNINTVNTNSIVRDSILQNNINTETANRVSADNALKRDITADNRASISRDRVLQKDINSVNSNSIRRDNVLQRNINTETNRAESVENVLSNNIGAVNTNSINRDNVLQNNIGAINNASIGRDNVLQNNISNVNTVQTNWNNQQDQQISGISSTLANQQSQLDNHGKRINNLERTQVGIRGELILQQGRREKVGLYSTYDTTRHTVSDVGICITIALDDSYEMKEIDKLNKRIERLNQKLESQDIETETVKEGNTTVIRIKQKEGVMKLMGKF